MPDTIEMRNLGSTRLRSERRNSWQEFPLISTRFRPYNYGFGLMATQLPIEVSRWTILNEANKGFNRGTAVYRTIIPVQSESFPLGANTTLFIGEIAVIEDNDFVIKPKYIDEFKIKVRSLRFDSSLPKIFVD